MQLIFDNGGSRYYGLYGETALVASFDDVGALSSHVVPLLHDGDRRFAPTTAGRDHVQHFDWTALPTCSRLPRSLQGGAVRLRDCARTSGGQAP
jgi:hypothetical protein